MFIWRVRKIETVSLGPGKAAMRVSFVWSLREAQVVLAKGIEEGQYRTSSVHTLEILLVHYMGGKFSIETTKSYNNSPYNKSVDPCSLYLDAYLLCVESKKDGLKEGDECSTEKDRYKLCRKESKAKP